VGVADRRCRQAVACSKTLEPRNAIQRQNARVAEDKKSLWADVVDKTRAWSEQGCELGFWLRVSPSPRPTRAAGGVGCMMMELNTPAGTTRGSERQEATCDSSINAAISLPSCPPVSPLLSPPLLKEKSEKAAVAKTRWRLPCLTAVLGRSSTVCSGRDHPVIPDRGCRRPTIHGKSRSNPCDPESRPLSVLTKNGSSAQTDRLNVEARATQR